MLDFAARDGGRALQALSADDRETIINNLANSLIEHQSDILAANQKDLEEARSAGTVNNMYLFFNLQRS